MAKTESSRVSRRSLLCGTAAALAGLSSTDRAWAAKAACSDRGTDADGEILGQGNFRYRAHRFWGRLDRHKYPVRDCHAIAEDRLGRIVMLTNDTHNNLIAYDKTGKFNA